MDRMGRILVYIPETLLAGYCFRASCTEIQFSWEQLQSEESLAELLGTVSGPLQAA